MKILMILAIILMYAVLTAVASSADSPTVMVTEYRVNPSIMMPEGIGTITIVAKNTANSATLKENSGFYTNEFTTTTVTDINVNIEKVRLYGNGMKILSKDFDRVGEIGPGQSVPFTFTVQAPMESGMYYPEVWIDTSGGRSTRYPIPVNVNTSVGVQKQAIMIIESSFPDTVNPGDEIPVALTIRNSGETLADDVTLKIDNVTSVIAPKSTAVYHVGPVPANEQKTVQVTLLSDKKTDPGLIRVPLTLQYSWLDGTVHTETGSIDIVMKGKAELGFVSVDTSPRRITANQPFDITIRIENTGTGEAKQVSATIDLPMTGIKQSFIGKIKPGNDAPAVFALDGEKGGTYDYTTTITYTDDLGTHTITKPMSLHITPEDFSGLIIMVLVLVLAGGFIAYRYWYLPRKSGNGALPWVKKS